VNLSGARPFVLFMEPAALERCFLIADVLAEEHGDPSSEYALIGLARRSRPFHVFDVLMLGGQEVTSGSVRVAGRNVAKAAREMDQVAERIGEAVFCPLFVHRHPPGSVDPSDVDDLFLIHVFVEQIATAARFSEIRVVTPSDWECDCFDRLDSHAMAPRAGRLERAMRVEFSVAFSLILNRRRQFSIDSAEILYCPECGAPRTRLAPAVLALPNRWMTSGVPDPQLKHDLATEIGRKIVNLATS
jgi:hypothetical protein